MNQSRRLIVKDADRTTAGKVSASVLPQFLQIFSKSAKGRSYRTEGNDPAPVSKRRDTSAMMVKPVKISSPRYQSRIFCF